jgi:hypothetical protein
MAEPSLQVILGVDTHGEVHVACLLDHLGRLQGTLTIPATKAAPSSYWPGPAATAGSPMPAWRAPAPTAPAWPAS